MLNRNLLAIQPRATSPVALSTLYGWGYSGYGAPGISNDQYLTPTPLPNSSDYWTQIESGLQHTVALKRDGTLWGWGSNIYGQLGNGEGWATALTPKVAVPASAKYGSWSAVSAYTHMFALATTGHLYAWGQNAVGQLGDNTAVGKMTITPIAPFRWLSSSIGGTTAAAVRFDGALLTTGSNTYGQLGFGAVGTSVSFHTKVGSSSWTMASSTGTRVHAIRADNTLWAWGLGQYGTLGDGTTINKSSPIQIGASSWTMVSEGVSHVAAIRSDGALFMWGGGTNGQLGDGTTIDKSSPVQIGTSSWTKVSAGDAVTIAIRSDGALFTWGANNNGRLGDGTTINKSSPVQIGTSSWTAVVASGTSLSNFVGAIRSDGALFMWGYGFNGQLGDGTTIDKSSPVQVGTSSWVALASSWLSTMAIKSDSTLWAWGYNNVGQLGDGTQTGKSSPIQIGTSSWTSVYASNSSTVAIRADGTLFAWGANASAQLGLSDTANRSSPASVGGSLWSKVVAGFSHSMGIRTDGTLWGWGYNASGANQIGDGTALNKSSPVQITAQQYVTPAWQQITNSNSSYATHAVRNDGTLYAWGRNVNGQLGDGTTIDKSSPVQIGTSSWAAISTGVSHTVAIFNDSTLWTWGGNANGQLGDGTTIDKSSPIQIGTSLWTAVFASNSLSVALRDDGALFTWGSGANGALGDGTTIDKSSPVRIGTQSWSIVSAGFNYVSAIAEDGRLYGWGLNDIGQLGDGTTINKSSPVQIGIQSWVAISATYNRMLGIQSNNTLWSWGKNDLGQLGDGTTINKSSPVQIGSNLYYSVFTSDGGASAAIRLDGSLWTWGKNDLGQLGDGTTINKSSPVQVGTSSWAAVGGLTAGLVAVRYDGTLWAWGNSQYGSVGDGTTINKSSPVQIGIITPFTFFKVDSGPGTHALGIRSDGTLWSWGKNDFGQLGIGTAGVAAGTLSPTPVGSSSWTAIAAGGSHSVALRSDGGLFTWGYGVNGSLGNGSATSVSSPIQVGTSSWIAIAAGNFHVAAIRSDGGLFTWGGNSYGQLGNNAGSNTSSPVQLGTSSWTAVAAGGVVTADNTYAIRSDGALFAWGRNFNGQLGDGTTVDKSSPVQIGTSSWTAVRGNNLYAFALRIDGTLWGWGNNANGQLGDTTFVSRSSPVQIGTSSWTAVASNQAYGGAAIRLDGTLWTWGFALNGNLGDFTIATRSSPVCINTGSWTALAGGNGGAIFAIQSDGTLWSWGQNTDFVLAAGVRSGGGIPINRSSPTAVVAGKTLISRTKFRDINAGYWQSVAHAVDNTVWGIGNLWGSYTHATQGASDGSTVYYPIQMEGYDDSTNPAPYTWTDVGFNLSVENMQLRRSDGTLWASGNAGPYLNSASTTRLVPCRFNGPYSIAKANTGFAFQAFIDPYGKLWKWSTDATNVGNNTTNVTASPILVSMDNWLKVGSSAADVTAAIRSDGALFMMGNNGNGKLGDGTTVSRSSPVQIGTSSWTAVSVGFSYAMAIRSDGGLFAWGANAGGQHGDGTTLDKSSPVQIGTSSWTAVVAGYSTSAAIRSDGALFVWGYNSNGQIGDGTTINKSSPVQIGTSSWTLVTTSLYNTAAIRTDGSLWSWGWTGNWPSQIATNPTVGDGTTISRSSPVQIGTSSWTKVAVGLSSAAAIRADGTLWVWGSGAAIGHGTQLSSPVMIPATAVTTKFKQIATHGGVISGSTQPIMAAISSTGTPFVLGTASITFYSTALVNQYQCVPMFNRTDPKEMHSWVSTSAKSQFAYFAIRSDGSLWSWGYSNAFGQLGDGQPTSSFALPTRLGNSSWTMVDSNAYGSAAIRSDGALFTWGQGGDIGDGSLAVTYRSPIQIGTSSWTMVSKGYYWTVALRADNTIWTWGADNTYGQLGRNNVSTWNSPLQVGTSSWSMVTTGSSSTAAIRTDGALFTWGYNVYGQLGDGTTINKSSPVQIGTSSWTMVQIGNATLALRVDGTIWAWGVNTSGNLGDGTTVNKSSPIQVGNLSNWTFINLGSNFATAAAIDSNSNLWMWGTGSNYGFGTGTIIVNRSSPVMFGAYNNQPGSSWSSVRVMDNGNVLGIRKDGSLYAWGASSAGAAPGYTTATTQSFPTAVGIRTSNKFKKIAVGTSNIMAISNKGRLFVAGTRGLTATPGEISYEVPPTAFTYMLNGISAKNDWSDISLTTGMPQAAIALKTDGSLWAWGGAGYGNLGDGTTIYKSSPVQIGTSYTALGYMNINDSYTGKAVGYALKNGGVYAWGAGVGGQTEGIAPWEYTSVFSPTQIGTSSWSAIGTNAYGTYGIRADGTLWGWGYTNFGQAGVGNFLGSTTAYSPVAFVPTPTQITAYYNGPTASWTAVACGGSHTVAIQADGSLWAWGVNAVGQLGDTTLVSKSSPILIDSGSWAAVAAGISHSFAIKSDGTLWGWGYNATYQFGMLDISTRSSPVQIGADIPGSWSFAGTGSTELYDTLVIRSDGTLWCSGSINSIGQLGVGDVLARSFGLVRVGNNSNWSSVARGGSHKVGLQTDGSMWTWGSSVSGQIGDGTTTNKSTPTKIGTSSWTAVSAGLQHTVAVRSDGTLWTWGLNTQGQLGDGTTINKSSPVQIGVQSNWTKVSAGSSSTMAIRSDGALFTWGGNSLSQLGDGTTLDKSSPVQIGTSSWTAVSAGYFGGAAIRSDGVMFMWGFPLVVGNLDAARTTNVSSPVQVNARAGKDVSFTLVGSGKGYHGHAIGKTGNPYGWGYNIYGQIGVGTSDTSVLANYRFPEPLVASGPSASSDTWTVI